MGQCKSSQRACVEVLRPIHPHPTQAKFAEGSQLLVRIKIHVKSAFGYQRRLDRKDGSKLIVGRQRTEVFSCRKMLSGQAMRHSVDRAIRAT